MKINISEVLANPGLTRQFDVVPEFTEFQYNHSSYPVSRKEPFVLTVFAEGGRLHLQGSTRMELLMPCDRCLDEVRVPFQIRIDSKVDFSEGKGEIEEESEEDTGILHVSEISYLEGGSLDVDSLLSDEIVLNLPGKVLCREDCKGLCSVCGTNLNHGSCSCDRHVGDPRMAAIRDLFAASNQDGTE